MAFIEWSEELQVGNEVIDEHHHHLIDMLNKAHDSFIYGMKKGELKLTVKALVDYADYHFAAEEKIMFENHYPEMADHISDHHAFRNTVNEMQKKHQKDHHPAYLELTDFLLEWMIRHINISDRAIFDYLANQGTSSTKTN